MKFATRWLRLRIIEWIIKQHSLWSGIKGKKGEKKKKEGKEKKVESNVNRLKSTYVISFHVKLCLLFPTHQILFPLNKQFSS